LPTLEYVRFFADAAGESHMERLRVDFATRDFVPPAPPIGVSSVTGATSYCFLHVEAGWIGDFHPSPARQWLFFISGEMLFELSDGQTFLGRCSAAILLEDTHGRGHRSAVPASGPAIMAAVQVP
jgi:hypothetical protein